MSSQPHDKPEPIDPELVAEDINRWLKTDTGKLYFTTLTKQHDDMLRFAQNETLTSEQKAFKVERAAGIDWAIRWLTERNNNHESGYYRKKKV